MPNIEVIEAPGMDALFDRTPSEVVWVSPLEVSFSQNVIYPKFSDGKSVDGTVDLIRPSGVRTCERTDCQGSETRLVLEAPFPVIEAVYWAPKLRDGSGKPLLDDQGNCCHGPLALFTVDNRRLYALQRAAVAQYPQQCCTPVSVISEGMEVFRHLKKFRTRTNGLSITVSEWRGVGRDNSRRYSTMRVWDWRSAVSRAAEGGGHAKLLAAEAASSGSCGCWEYLDHHYERRGPFSNWQMRQWWERKMFPPDLIIRPYDAAATLTEKGPAPERPYLPVAEVFKDAPSDFAPGFSPRATDGEASMRRCCRCGKKRWESWGFDGQWYCDGCWRRWATKHSREAERSREKAVPALHD